MKRFKLGVMVVAAVRGRGVAFGWMPKVQAGERCPAVIIGPRAQVQMALARMGVRLTGGEA